MKAGDKVVCVDDNWTGCPGMELHKKLPKKGEVYCVREVRISTMNGKPVIHLIGLVSKTNPWSGKEQGFRASRFRPVAEVGHPPISVSVDLLIPTQ